MKVVPFTAWSVFLLLVYPAATTSDQQTHLYLWQLFSEDASNWSRCGDGCIRFHLEDKHPEIRGTVTTALLYIYDHSSELNRSANQEHSLEVNGVNIHGRPHHLVASRDLTETEYMEHWKTLDITQTYEAWKMAERKEVTIKVSYRGDMSNSRFRFEESYRSFILVGVSSLVESNTPRIGLHQHHRARRSANHENSRSNVSRKCQSNAVNQECCVQDVHVSLRQLGDEFSWILSPRDFTIGRCVGRCSSFRLTTLAVFLGRRSNIGAVCCHPSAYEPINIVFQDHRVGFLLDASAKHCSCS